MPQEIEVWYIIPALRRELAKVMINDMGLSQKGVSKVMNITEAAVSQYINSKRAKDVIFTKNVMKEIKVAAKKVKENNSLLIPEMTKLTRLTGVKQVMCYMHKKQDINLPENCEICFEDDIIKIK